MNSMKMPIHCFLILILKKVGRLRISIKEQDDPKEVAKTFSEFHGINKYLTK
jgi:hypothetical protein